MRNIVVGSGMAAVIVSQSLAQVRPANDAPRFDVVSVKPSSGYQPMPTSPTRFQTSNMTVEMLIEQAFGLPKFRIVGGPEWVRSDRYDVHATMARPWTFNEVLGGLRHLLADRFGLATHVETRPQSAYALVFSRKDRGFGPALRRSNFDCQRAARSGESIPKAADGLPVCTDRIRGVGEGRTRWEVGGVTMTAFAQTLEKLVQRAVVDRTDASGTFDFDVTYLPPSAVLRSDGATPSNGVSIEVALQEQLALKLEPGSEPVEVLVIDHVERPRPD